VTYDGIDTTKMYRDGVLGHTDTNGIGGIDDSSHTLFIGKRRGSTYYYFNGTIDSLRVHNRSLTAEEIRLSMGSSLKQRNSTHWEFYSNITGEPDGSYTYLGWANDTAGNTGKTETRTLTLNATLLTVAINSPITGEYLQNLTITINGTTTTNYLNFTNISIYNSSGALINSTINYSAVWSVILGVQVEGEYIINATAYDNLTRSKSITVNITVEQLHWGRPEGNNKSILGGWFFQNITVVDTNLYWINCSIYNASGYWMWNSSFNLTGRSSYNLYEWVNISSWNYGVYTENCTVWAG